MRTVMWTLSCAGLFAACSSGIGLTPDDSFDVEDFDTDSSGEVRRFDYSITVFPSRDAGDATALLPQQFVVPVDASTDLTLTMQSPALLSGTVDGYLVTPRNPTLPGQDVRVQGEVQALNAASIQSRFTATDELGQYAVSLVPGSVYNVAILPDDPLLPIWSQAIEVNEDTVLDVDLGAGVAVWGQIRMQDGPPLAGAHVVLVHSDEVRSVASITDEQGFYLIRATPGRYAVEVSGRDSGRDPTLSSPVAEVGEDGLRVDIQYSGLSLVNVGGRVLATGIGLANARVRITAQTLQTYEGREATLQVDAVTNSAGNFDTRVPPGTYTIEVLPSLETGASAVRLTDVEISSDTDLGSLAALPFRTVDRLVTDEAGTPVVGAGIRCSEVGGDSRSVSTNSGDDGRFVLGVPMGPVSCLVTPPGDGLLASTVLRLDLGEDEFPDVILPIGRTVSGTLDADRGQDVSFAFVEVRDANGQLWGTTITDDQGRFSLQVGWSPTTRR